MTLQGIKSDCLASWRFPSRVYWAQYALDFLFMIACFAITGGVNGYVKPFHRDFDPTDPSLNYPMHPDSVSYGVMTGVMIAVSFVVFVVAQIRVRSTIDLHFAIFGLAQALSITLMITEVVKVIAGRFRPDWIARCIPDADKNCTNTDESVVNDGRMSFFSGHTSTAFVLMTFLALYVSGKIRPLQAGGHFYRFIICIAPVCAATWVGISRTMDNRHHFDDVLTGAAVGILFACVIYFQHFPNPFKRDACCVDRPYQYYAMKKKQREEEGSGDVEEGGAKSECKGKCCGYDSWCCRKNCGGCEKKCGEDGKSCGRKWCKNCQKNAAVTEGKVEEKPAEGQKKRAEKQDSMSDVELEEAKDKVAKEKKGEKSEKKKKQDKKEKSSKSESSEQLKSEEKPADSDDE